jgi:hypothetical protein
VRVVLVGETLSELLVYLITIRGEGDGVLTMKDRGVFRYYGRSKGVRPCFPLKEYSVTTVGVRVCVPASLVIISGRIAESRLPHTIKNY